MRNCLLHRCMVILKRKNLGINFYILIFIALYSLILFLIEYTINFIFIKLNVGNIGNQRSLKNQNLLKSPKLLKHPKNLKQVSQELQKHLRNPRKRKKRNLRFPNLLMNSLQRSGITLLSSKFTTIFNLILKNFFFVTHNILVNKTFICLNFNLC